MEGEAFWTPTGNNHTSQLWSNSRNYTDSIMMCGLWYDYFLVFWFVILITFITRKLMIMKIIIMIKMWLLSSVLTWGNPAAKATSAGRCPWLFILVGSAECCNSNLTTRPCPLVAAQLNALHLQKRYRMKGKTTEDARIYEGKWGKRKEGWHGWMTERINKYIYT